MSNVVCPVCGSSNVRSLPEVRKVSASNGEMFDAHIHHDICDECHFEGDFSDRNEQLILDQRKAFEATAYRRVIDSLAAQGMKMAAVERSVGLPARTIARWKKDGGSSAGLALLSIINVCPWMLKVSSANYDRQVADQVMLGACSDAMDRIKSSLSSFHGQDSGWVAKADLPSGGMMVSRNFGLIYVSKSPLTNTPAPNAQKFGKDEIEEALSVESANVFVPVGARG